MVEIKRNSGIANLVYLVGQFGFFELRLEDGSWISAGCGAFLALWQWMRHP